jgi:hypothetical protein
MRANLVKSRKINETVDYGTIETNQASPTTSTLARLSSENGPPGIIGG